jgi:hypothetical protein
VGHLSATVSKPLVAKGRSQNFVMVQEFYCWQMRALPNVAERSWVCGFNSNYEFVLAAGAKAKTVTTVSAEASA